MNILILNWRDPINPKSGGAEIVTMEYAKGWLKNGHKVVWFSQRFKTSKRRESINNIDVVRRGNNLTVYLHAFIYFLKNRHKIDFVIDEIHGIPFFTPIYVRKPKIAFIHEVAGEIWDYMYPFPINVIGKLIERFIFIPYKKTNFITVSNSTAQDLRRFGVNKIYIIENGLNSISLKKVIKEKNPTFIFVSRVVKMKGIEDVIDAFYIISKDLKDAKLWIVGDGDKKYINYLVSRIEKYKLNNIKFFGKVSEHKKYDLMKKSQILLHASVKEGWGLVVLEAASQGTPAIVYNVAGLRDSVINDKTGKVLINNSPFEMAKESIDLIKNKKKYMQLQKGSIEWAKEHEWKNSIRESLLLFKKVMSE